MKLITMDLCEPIWERQKGERTKAYHLFTLYRDMGPLRSLSKLHAKLTEETLKPIGERQIKEYSRKCGWNQRATAYDDHIERIMRLEEEEAIKQMTKRHAQTSEQLQEELLALREDPSIQALREKKPTSIVWTYDRVINGYKELVGIERLSRGEPSEHVKEDVNARVESELKNVTITPVVAVKNLEDTLNANPVTDKTFDDVINEMETTDNNEG